MISNEQLEFFLRSRSVYLKEIWQNYLKANWPQTDRWLSDYFKNKKKFGKRDRLTYSELLFLTIRHSLFALATEDFFQFVTKNKINDWEKDVISFFLAWEKDNSDFSHLDKKLKSINSEDVFLWAYLRDRHFKSDSTSAFVDSTLKIDFFRRLKTCLQSQEKKSLPLKLLIHSVPIALEFRFQERINKSWDESKTEIFLSSLDNRPPLWLRCRSFEDKEKVIKELHDNYFSVQTEPHSLALEVKGSKGIFELELYKNGLAEIQDYASQMIGAAVDVRPSQTVWDVCAGGGGKTMQIASHLKNKGVVYASDIRSYKLEEVKTRAKRGQFFNVRCLPWNGTQVPEFSKEISLRKGFGRVLVDAPCSSSGTWRRNPDAKFRISENSITELTAIQSRILKIVAPTVREEGLLIYSTCSWFVEENEHVVEEFLGSDCGHDFHLKSMELLGSPLANCDTMFVAVLERVKA